MINSKRLHIHAIPVVVTLLALTFLIAGMYLTSHSSNTAGKALVRPSFGLTTGTDGKLHLGLAEASQPFEVTATVEAPATALMGAALNLQKIPE